MSVLGMDWIKHQFDDNIFIFRDDGTEWKVGEKITEKTISFDVLRNGIRETAAESQAVYHCHQVVGPSVVMEAIMKIRIQVPPHDPASEDPAERAKLAIMYPGQYSTNELKTLQHLGSGGCTVTPKLLAWFNSWQSPDMPISGGYMLFLVMEKLPGEPLTDFWDRPFEEREKIRAAFMRAGEEFNRHRVYHYDERLGNLLYDAKEDKWYATSVIYSQLLLIAVLSGYFLDFEPTEIFPEEGIFFGEKLKWGYKFEEVNLFTWGLVYSVNGKNHY